jgi:hypothetical protein
VSLDSLSYLFEIYWPYMLAVLIVGLGSGWVSYTVPRK